ncbi:hypothetical protein NDU88_001322 [Pleurodeles waltl]|uniref:Uncharacterized protein n=1 Tax=Pleurodeles waltl TaxID=8319 RepID=A0AAV7S721_PLEWA|nr:hypothetical protein NDU88_001322 [Pleurodeles waltl]
MDRILKEISAVGLEGMDNAMVALMVETRSMRLEIAGFANLRAGPLSDDSGNPSCLLDRQRTGTPAPP